MCHIQLCLVCSVKSNLFIINPFIQHGGGKSPPEKFWTISKAMAPSLSLVIPHTNPLCQLAPCFLMLQAIYHSHSLNSTLLNAIQSCGTR